MPWGGIWPGSWRMVLALRGFHSAFLPSPQMNTSVLPSPAAGTEASACMMGAASTTACAPLASTGVTASARLGPVRGQGEWGLPSVGGERFHWHSGDRREQDPRGESEDSGQESR